MTAATRTRKELKAETLVAAALEYPGNVGITCSFQAGGIVLLSIIRRFQPDIPVLFVDTGLHFPETYAFRDQLVGKWDLNLVNITPGDGLGEGLVDDLPLTNPNLCCRLRKVDPLLRALEDYDIWFTALRRDQAPTRAATPRIDRYRLPTGKQLIKVNPIVDWSWEEVLEFSRANDLPLHPLYAAGYPSIGCAPCTSLPLDPSNARSGRWNGTKTECGIHPPNGEASTCGS
ncbi:phosphoadenosine phosphosulfate reductase [bacterium BMS3Abin02]|nr:phosphoadenosine phosphosulfate reductase [bacterium BMS3Abin02]GBE21925.1 phosphoadenosine phosphosulfate reductase [bacterium BMS3Bbin01]HDH25365.1 phosphoadenylyl-sulfate reductase [Actinomycetota bacterium]